MQRGPKNWFALLILEGLFLLALSLAVAKAESGLFGASGQTFGGRFVWSDEVIYRNWRIQKHAVIGHYRLIDPQDRLHARGSIEHCLAELEEVKQTETLAPLPREMVIVVHGLGASRQWMNSLSKYLEEKGGLAVVNVGYPSTKGEIGDHARSLASVIRHLEGVETINFVAHSMGNIVIRHYLSDLKSLPAPEQLEITYKRFVMIAPPNHGAVVADKLGDRKFVQMFGGEAVEQLAPSKGWRSLEKCLATPSFEFGIVVGGIGDDEGYLDAVPGDDDTLLSVATSKLAGAADFVQIRGIHQTLPRNEQVQQVTLRFLQTGAFLPSGRRHPIVAAEGLVRPR